MAFFDFLASKKEPPKVKGFAYGGFTLSYDVTYDIFYKFYEFNAFIASAIQKRMEDVGAYGYELRARGESIAIDEFTKLINFGIPYSIKSFISRLVRDYEVTGNAYVYLKID